jgi:hypothetical protein
VVGQLKLAGVKTDRLSVSDGMPGGTGVSSERMVIILDESENASRATRRTAGTGRITQ